MEWKGICASFDNSVWVLSIILFQANWLVFLFHSNLYSILVVRCYKICILTLLLNVEDFLMFNLVF